MNYKEMLSEYPEAASAENVAAELTRIKAIATRNETPAVWSKCFAAMDLTSLGAADSERSVGEFVGRAARLAIEFPNVPHPASVCVWPLFVDTAGIALGSSPIAITSVAGGFPSSQTFIEVRMLEVAMAIESGADEVDIVISVGETLEGDYDRMASSLRLLRDEAGDDTVMKVIVEASALGLPRTVRDASLLAMMAGADFVKTSTGKGENQAPAISTPEAAIVMCTAIKDFHAKTGRKVGFKVAGGVRGAADASLYYTIVEEILGEEWLSPQFFRIGASGLANNLLSKLEGREIEYF